MFWFRGYDVDTVGENAKKIENYIQMQLQEDIANDRISLKQYADLFTGKKSRSKLGIRKPFRATTRKIL